MTIALSATGHGAMECTITNACEKGETILIACNGIWGDRASDMANRAGINVERLGGIAGVSFKLDQIENALKKVLLSYYNNDNYYYLDKTKSVFHHTWRIFNWMSSKSGRQISTVYH